MKTYILTRMIIAVLMLPMVASAASFVVWPGQSLQAAINAAAAGDNITIQTGTYDENITITKGIDIRGVGGAVLVTGTLTVTNPALPVYLADISFGKTGASGMTFTGISNGSQKIRMDRCKLVGGGDLVCTRMIAYFYRNQFGNNVTFNSSTWTFQRCTVGASLVSTNSTAKCIASTVTTNLTHNVNAKEITIFRSTVGEFTNVTLPVSVQGWIAYSTLRRVELSGGVIEVVGNHFNGRNNNNDFLTLNDQCQSLIRNNLFWDDDRYINYNGNSRGRNAIVIKSTSSTTQIFNNTIRDIYTAIVVEGSPAGVEIRGNIHRDAVAISGVPAPRSVVNTYEGTIVANNNFQYSVTGGVQSGNINVNPNFISVSPSNLNFLRLSDTSSSRNRGPVDAIFNDIDGSRNDLGAYGGHSYDPTGRTTLKPVVLSGGVNPLYVKRGGAVTIKARAAVVAP